MGPEPSKLKNEIASVKKLALADKAHGYILMTNAKITEGDRTKICILLKECGILQPYVFGREWIVHKIIEHPRVRALAPRIYGLGDLSWITDERALEQAKAIIDSMGDDLACYVPTQAHQKAVAALSKYRTVLLLGDPAVGKTSIAAALAIAATDENGGDVVFIRNPSEFVATFNPNIEGRLFWIDDAFGSIQYTPELSDAWNKVFQTMKAAISRDNRFILTSRSYIWRQAKQDLKLASFSPLQDGSVVVDVENLKEEEKERILYNHLKFGKQSPAFLSAVRPHLNSVLKLPIFRPEIARRLGDPAFTRGLQPTMSNIVDFFRNPEILLNETIVNLDSAFQAAIGLIFVSGGRLISPLVENSATLLISDSYGVGLHEIKEALYAMNGSFVAYTSDDEDSYWTYKHPTIGDAFANIVGKNEELVAIYLSGAKISQILREARCGKSDVKGASIAVGASQYALLFDRFANSEYIPESTIRRFLITRCGSRFFKEFLKRFPVSFPWGSALSRPAQGDDRTRLIVKAFELGVLPEEERKKFVSNLRDQIIDEADIEFFLYDEVCDILTVEEHTELLALVRTDLSSELNSYIDNEADNFDDSWEPDEWFSSLEGNIEALESLFPDDDEITEVVQGAREAIAEKVRELKQRIEERHEEPDDDRDSWASAQPRSGLSVHFSGERSIFDDLV